MSMDREVTRRTHSVLREVHVGREYVSGCAMLLLVYGVNRAEEGTSGMYPYQFLAQEVLLQRTLSHRVIL